MECQRLATAGGGHPWEHVIDAHTLAPHEVITFQNFGLQPIKFPVLLTFESAFENVYAVRELPPEPFDTRRPPSWNHGILSVVRAKAASIGA